jgi:iron complex outermembrane receptor protein
MTKRRSNLKQILAAGCAALAMVGAAGHADAQGRAQQYTIQQQALGAALRTFALNSGRDVLFDPALVQGKTTRGVSGRLRDEDALRRLLQGSGLSFENTNSGGFVVRGAIRAEPAQGDAPAPQSANEAAELEEIIVTVSKTGASVRDVDGSISGLSGASLAAIGAQSAEDYLMRTPGVIFNAQQAGNSTITIRGVATSTNSANISQATTGIYVNDIPLTDPYFSAGTPDIDTFDVDHVEVHRGPQGTLFGSASLGGAVNYVSKRANAREMEVGAETVQSFTAGADDLNSSYRVMVNVPVVQDRFAVRIVGAYRQDASYIDDVGTGDKDANDVTIKGGRVLASWTPQDGTEVSWVSLYQQTQTSDEGYMDPAVGDLKKAPLVREPSDFSVLIHSLRLDQDLGFANLSAIASFHKKTSYFLGDYKRYALFGFDHAFLDDRTHSSGNTFEARLASKPGGPLQWLIGAMYDKTEMDIIENAHSYNSAAVGDALLGPGGGALSTFGDVWGTTQLDFTGKEMAVFGEASYTFAERLKVTLGGRLFKTEAQSDSYGFGLLYAVFLGALVNDPAPLTQKEEGFNPKASISFDLTSDARIYALASKGFRFGGANINPAPQLPTGYGSDSLWNYEVGLKSEWLDHKLQLDVSLFQIDWTGIQLSVVVPNGTQGILNAGDAKIRGAEAALAWRVTPQLTIDSSVTYMDANLERISSPFSGLSPAQLPGASDWLVANSIRYQWDGAYQPFLMLSHRYVSEAPGFLQHFSIQNPTIGGYNTFDLRAGLTVGELQLAAFANNLTDERGVQSATYTGDFGDELHQYVLRPRTLGLSLTWKR